MASSETPTGRPPGGTEVKVGGPARARAIELIKNPRRQYGASLVSPPYCRLRFLISLTVRALAGPSKYIFHADGPSMLLRQQRGQRLHAWSLLPPGRPPSSPDGRRWPNPTFRPLMATFLMLLRSRGAIGRVRATPGRLPTAQTAQTRA